MKKNYHFGAKGFLLMGLITFLAYCTIVSTYDKPDRPYWDEQFHITSAQKYLNGIYFMHVHPPLGKMAIALGEKLIDANPPGADRAYIGIRRVNKPNKDISMKGYRLIPALLAWLLVPLSFIIFFLLIKDRMLSALLSFLVIFDTAQIIHLRSAVLEGPLVFATALSTLFFLIIPGNKKNKWRFALFSFLLGISCGAAAVTKLNGLFLILFVPLLLILLWPDWKLWLKSASLAVAGFLIVFAGIWQLHFSLSTAINPDLNNKGYFGASEAYREVLDRGGRPSILLFPVMLRDSFEYMLSHHKGVPKLDLCTKKQNGSTWASWPFGGRSMHFLSSGPDKNGISRNVYFQANPAVWWTATLGVVLAVFMLLS